ncbi:MAG: Csu type fimbrial protein [Rhodanobacter sp.]
MSLRIFLLMLVVACCQVAPESSHAATSNVTCSTTITPVNFGQISPASTATIRVNGGIQFSCTNVSLLAAQNVTLCLGLGQGSGTSITPTRQMNGPSSSILAFQLYQDSGYSQVWGNVPSTSNPAPMVLKFTIPLSVLGLPAIYNSPTYPVYGSLTTPQAGAASGSYSNTLNGSLTYQANNAPLLGTNYPANCDGGASSGFSLSVQASVASQCTVSAGSPLILGSAAGVAAGTNNNTGSTTFSVNCTQGTLYNVGLSPSSNSLTGAGSMAGTGGNTSKVPYQLYQSVAGTTVWGNTATSSSVGNGEAGTGNGSAQSMTVYATAPSSDFKPDTYSDTVTINVSY